MNQTLPAVQQASDDTKRPRTYAYFNYGTPMQSYRPYVQPVQQVQTVPKPKPETTELGQVNKRFDFNSSFLFYYFGLTPLEG